MVHIYLSNSEFPTEYIIVWYITVIHFTVILHDRITFIIAILLNVMMSSNTQLCRTTIICCVFVFILLLLYLI